MGSYILISNKFNANNFIKNNYWIGKIEYEKFFLETEIKFQKN